MKSIAIKFILILVVVGLLSLIIEFTLPYGWADEVQYPKIAYYKKNQNQFNTLFFGGSLEYRQINPKVFDSIMKKNGFAIKSYNLGVDAHILIHSIADLEGVIKNNPNNRIKYIFISLSSEPYFFIRNKNTSKHLAWNNASSTYRAITTLFQMGEQPLQKNIKYCYLYFRSWFMNAFKMGMLSDAVKFHTNTDSLYNKYVGINNDGFFPYNDEQQYLISFNKGLDSIVTGSRKWYVENPKRKDSILQANINQFNTYQQGDKVNQAQVNMMLSIIEKYAKMGIDVYYILPARAITSYNYLLPIYYALPKERCINIADPRKYPEFYTKQNSYNFHHVNKKGAIQYSKTLAEEFSKLLSSTQNN